jgi:hypothetical protein
MVAGESGMCGCADPYLHVVSCNDVIVVARQMDYYTCPEGLYALCLTLRVTSVVVIGRSENVNFTV